jgi:hypothetical protein
MILKATEGTQPKHGTKAMHLVEAFGPAVLNWCSFPG